MSWFYTFFSLSLLDRSVISWAEICNFFAVSARIQWLNSCAIDYFQKLIISHKYVTFELLLNIQRYIRWWKQYKCYFWGLISGGNIKNNQVSARNIFDSKRIRGQFLIIVCLVNFSILWEGIEFIKWACGEPCFRLRRMILLIWSIFRL